MGAEAHAACRPVRAPTVGKARPPQGCRAEAKVGRGRAQGSPAGGCSGVGYSMKVRGQMNRGSPELTKAGLSPKRCPNMESGGRQA